MFRRNFHQLVSALVVEAWPKWLGLPGSTGALHGERSLMVGGGTSDICPRNHLHGSPYGSQNSGLSAATFFRELVGAIPQSRVLPVPILAFHPYPEAEGREGLSWLLWSVWDFAAKGPDPYAA